MNRQIIKIGAVAVCMAAAGIFYGYTRYGGTAGKGVDFGVWEMAAPEESTGWAEITLESSAPESEEAAQATQTTEAAVYYYVHICGEVASPGVYQLEEGSRVFQAVEAAGGLTDQAAGAYLNQAQEVTDGMRIAVPSMEEVKGKSLLDGAGEQPGGSSPGKVNLNTATAEELMTLPGIGESRARDIIQYREQHGGFQTIEEITNVSGIKAASFEKIRDHITV